MQRQQHAPSRRRRRPPPAPEAPSCLICLQSLRDGHQTEALLCGHVYHTHCLNQYVQVTGKPKQEACAMKCHGSTVVPQATGEDEAAELADDEVDDSPADDEGEAAAHAIP